MNIYAVIKREPCEDDWIVRYYTSRDRAEAHAVESNRARSDFQLEIGIQYDVKPIEVVE